MKTVFFICFFVLCINAFAGTPEKVNDYLQNGLKISLDPEGKAYSKISFTTQFWARNTQLNEGTCSQNGDLENSEFDFALRRTRFSMYNNINDKFILYTQLGFNNICATSSKPQLYFHDIWGMFRVAPKACYIGFGLNGWNGISRLSNTSYSKTLTLDNPGVNIPNVNHTDVETRQLGVFAKGTVDRVSYRLALSKPFVYDGVPSEPESDRGYEYPSTSLSYKGYVAWHFADKEYFNTPYLDMTYLGKKKICNIGAGFDIYPKSIAEYDEAGNSNLKDRKLFGVDCFLEYPFVKGQSVTFYSVWYNYDFGKNYLRSSGTMNIWTEGSGVEGAGNNEYKIGTGNIFYSNLGFMFGDQFLHLPGRLQLFYAFTEKNLEALTSDICNHDFGMNYYVAGQKLKFSLQYSLRPYIDEISSTSCQHLGTMIFQIQMSI